jgi:4-diphosphocytidyl-2-C-methyl-D-erythritol kinase
MKSEKKNVVKLRAFAKVNLWLEVLERRADGYHELRTIFQAISLHDTLEMWPVREPGIFLETDSPEISSGPENLIWKAVEAMGREIGVPGGIAARLTKRIPAGRGLGGGSSDAAAAIVGMLRLTKKCIPLGRLFEIACGLGADVPFFLAGGRAIGVGRGEEIYPLPDGNKQPVVVVSPRDIAVPTRDAYQWVSAALTKEPAPHKIYEFCALCSSLQEHTLKNDFETAVFRQHPRLRDIKWGLIRAGAVDALLAGSGSAVFGVFRNPAKARRAARQFPDDQTFVSETLARGQCARLHGLRIS